MFWKKRRPHTDMLIHETPDKRDTFRYTFALPRPPVIQFLNTTVELIDISAGGVSFKNHGFNPGDRDRITLHLGDEEIRFKYKLCIVIVIVSIDAHKICHCLFEAPDVDQTEAIHRFLLLKQKKDIRESLHPR
ncbi:hypothetical protein HRM2_28650 [Desulforapulum autotrophicum HRM2]|uniref:PilZ domain-containing protein n=2 Tax=Desulforapulum autotrophicum TaxID=2296 RepID=C0QJE0_DESAH|nr:hypothetical protein HRM2_28650 [Desulforapulum autotrophicum HRM2]